MNLTPSSAMPFALMPAMDPSGRVEPPGTLPAGEGNSGLPPLDLKALMLELDNQLEGVHVAPGEVEALVADLLESFEGGPELRVELQAVITQLQSVAQAGARSPLLDPAAAGLGGAPRVELDALLTPDVAVMSSVVSSPEVLPASHEAVFAAAADLALSAAPTAIPAAAAFDAGVTAPSVAVIAPVVSAEHAAGPVTTAVDAPTVGTALAEALASQGAGPTGAADAARVSEDGASVPAASRVSSSLATPAAEAGVAFSRPAAPAVALPLPLPFVAGSGGDWAGVASRPVARTAPPVVIAPKGSSLPDSVKVLSRAPSAPVASRDVAMPATRSVGSGTFDGTPWLITAADKSSPESILLPPSEVDPEAAPERAPRTRTTPQAATRFTPVVRSGLLPTIAASTIADGASQSGGAEVNAAQGTNGTRPALSAVRGPALSAQLSQAAQASVPDAPVTVADRPLQRVDLRVRDGERSMRLGVVREADGYAVEVRAPRDVVAEIRDLEADVDAALREDGDDGLASFDTFVEDDSLDGLDFFEEDSEAETVDSSQNEVVSDPTRLLDRRV